MTERSLRARTIQDVVSREPVFTSDHVVSSTGATDTAVAKLLKRLHDEGTLSRIMRGLWANPRHTLFSPYLVVGQLANTWGAPIYVSGISALHLHGMLSQIPREIHVAVARSHAPLETPVGRFIFHRLQRDLLEGTQPGDKWGRFALATPEKALFDTLYFGLREGFRWNELPEIELPATWDWRRWDPWLRRVAFTPLRRQLEMARTGMGGSPKGPTPKRRSRRLHAAASTK